MSHETAAGDNGSGSIAREPPRSEFRAAAYPAAKRYESFRESMGCVFDVTDPTRQGEDFDGHISTTMVGDTALVGCQTVGQRFSRDASKIAADGIDHYLVQMYMSGSKNLHTGDAGPVGVGQLAVIDTAQPYHSEASDFFNVTLVIPRHLISQRLLAPDRHACRVFSPDDVLAQLASDSLRSLWNVASRLSADQALVAAQPTIDLVVAALNGHVDAAAGTRSAVQRARATKIREHIEHNLSDPSLSTESLQSAFGLSRSALYRVFAPQLGIASYIRERRLDRSARELAREAFPPRTLMEVALDAGFSSDTAFGRAFKKRFGMSPGEARGGHQAGARRTMAEARFGDRLWEEWFRTL